MGQLLFAGLIEPLLRLQAALTVWVLRQVFALLAWLWRGAGQVVFMAAGALADFLYANSDPDDPHAFDDLVKTNPNRDNKQKENQP